MKIRQILLIALFSIGTLFAKTVTLNSGWNLMGGVTNNDMDLSKINISWTYSEGEWDHSLNEGFTLNSQQGVWFLNLNQEELTYNKPQNSHEQLNLVKGWNLVGDLNGNFDLSHANILYIFEYADGEWVINPSSSTIQDHKGYWVYTNENITLYNATLNNKPPTISFDTKDLDDTFYISDSDLNSLPIQQKRYAIDKILTSFYIGLSPSGMDQLITSTKPVSTLLDMFAQSNPAKLYEIENNLENYHYHWKNKVAAKSLGRLFLLPVSKEYIDMWTAYQLANSKFYSASLELNTVEDGTGVNLSQSLYKDISNDTPISAMLYNYLDSEEHWSRFRSPEDNTREVLELQLGIFEDSLVPLASQACQNYSYNEREKNLIIDFNYNYTPINIFESTIYSCDQFYNLVSKQELVKEEFIKYFVEVYLPLLSSSEKDNFINEIKQLELNTYKDILVAIIFSDKFIFEGEKMRSIEELYLSYAKKVDYIPSLSSFKYFAELAYDSGQSIMYHKLGRAPSVPNDILSYATLSKGLRDKILMDIKYNMFNEWDSGWSSVFMESVEFTSIKTMCDSLSLHMLNKTCDQDELELFENIFSEYNLSSDYHKSIMVQVVLDYFSQLPQTYVSNSIQK